MPGMDTDGSMNHFSIQRKCRGIYGDDGLRRMEWDAVGMYIEVMHRIKVQDRSRVHPKDDNARFGGWSDKDP